jgi:hypothetical protein
MRDAEKRGFCSQKPLFYRCFRNVICALNTGNGIFFKENGCGNLQVEKMLYICPVIETAAKEQCCILNEITARHQLGEK